MDLAYLAFSSLAKRLTLLRTPYIYMLLGAPAVVFLIPYWLKKYKTSYIAISIYYFPIVFNLEGRLHS